MYIYLSSGDSQHIFPDNRPTSFRVRLSRPLNLHTPHEIALVDAVFPKFKDGYRTGYITVKSSLCEDSLIDSTLSPVLARIFSPNQRTVDIYQPRYMHLNTSHIYTIDIHLSDTQGQEPSFETGLFYCTLHIRKCLE